MLRAANIVCSAVCSPNGACDANICLLKNHLPLFGKYFVLLKGINIHFDDSKAVLDSVDSLETYVRRWPWLYCTVLTNEMIQITKLQCNKEHILTEHPLLIHLCSCP